jgi:uncharacterized protein DUF6081
MLATPTVYAVFSSVFRPVPRGPDQQVKVTVAYNRTAGVVRWLDDAEVARVSRIGFPAVDATTSSTTAALRSGRTATVELRDGAVHVARWRADALWNGTGFPCAAIHVPDRVRGRTELVWPGC